MPKTKDIPVNQMQLILPLPKHKATNRNVSAFLNKLYSMVSDPVNNEYIRWSDDGQSFLVPDHENFAISVLPRYFKHSNFHSFIRQLNMYGFHKVPHIEQGSLLSGPDVMEFKNQNFQKNRPDLLCFVVRRKTNGNEENVKDSLVDVPNVLNELSAIKRHQFTISADLSKMQRENEQLWRENKGLALKYDHQQATINKILGFLASVFSAKQKIASNKRRRLLIEEFSDDDESRKFPNSNTLLDPLNDQYSINPTTESLNLMKDLFEESNSNFMAITESNHRNTVVDPTKPTEHDLETLNDRIDSLSYLMQDSNKTTNLKETPSVTEKSWDIDEFVNLPKDEEFKDADLDEFFAE